MDKKISEYFTPIKRRITEHDDNEISFVAMQTAPQESKGNTTFPLNSLKQKSFNSIPIKLDASFSKDTTKLKGSSQCPDALEHNMKDIFEELDLNDAPLEKGISAKFPTESKKRKSEDMPDPMVKIQQKRMERFVEVDADSKRKMEKKERFKVANKSKYAFLDNICDENKNPIGSKNYDPRTLHIPPHILAQMTPFEKQYWEIKMKRFDTIIFFNKGKFYELMEQDAEIAQRILGMAMTERAGMRMCGMPKTSFYQNCSKLIQHGYKVCRVVQTETPVDRVKKQETKVGTGKIEDIMLERTVDRIITPGTIVEFEILEDHTPRYLLVLKQDGYRLGICIVDCSAAEFQIGEVEDDDEYSNLRTLLFQLRPKEVVYLKGNLSVKVMNMFKVHLDANSMMTPRTSTDFWDYDTTVDKLTFETGLLISENESSLGYEHIQSHIWPKTLTQHKNNRLVMETFGGCVSYLKDVNLASQLLIQRNIDILDIYKSKKCMVLDSKALSYLDIVENNWDRSLRGTLLRVLDHCKTTFGKRLLKKWIIHPLLDINDINERLDSVDLLIREPAITDSLNRFLKNIPDLERLFSSVQARTISVQNYRKLLDSLERISKFYINEVPGLLDLVDDHSSLVIGLLSYPSQHLPDFSTHLAKIQALLCQDELLLDKVVPVAGFNAEYDQARNALDIVLHQLEDHIKLHRNYFKSTQVCYVEIGKNYFLIEVPNKLLTTIEAPKEFIKHKKSTSKVTRFYTSEVLNLLPQLERSKRDLELCEANVLKFCSDAISQDYANVWSHVVSSLAKLDCLNSLGIASGQSIYMCRPTFENSDTSFIEITDMRHPCMLDTGREFIPNDLVLKNSSIVLTGPNMGGKSTILRQLCINVIMAQIGCYVCASTCQLSPVDRIFTRIGASDNIFEGQSTFMTEIKDTATMLNNATSKSLVILDELGRGTSTFDGYSIAYATLLYTASKIKCRTLFSTHFHMLADDREISSVNNINMYHMTANVDEQNDDITFLYKMEPGSNEKVYGMQVARMAGVSQSIVSNAKVRALVFRIATQNRYKNYSELYVKLDDIKTKMSKLKLIAGE